MIIVYPDDIATLVTLDNLIGECLVEILVVFPGMIFVCLALGMVGHLVMKDGPKDGFAVVDVVSIEIAVANVDGQGFVFGFQLLGYLLLCDLFELIGWEADSS